MSFFHDQLFPPQGPSIHDAGDAISHFVSVPDMAPFAVIGQSLITLGLVSSALVAVLRGMDLRLLYEQAARGVFGMFCLSQLDGLANDLMLWGNRLGRAVGDPVKFEALFERLFSWIETVELGWLDFGLTFLLCIIACLAVMFAWASITVVLQIVWPVYLVLVVLSGAFRFGLDAIPGFRTTHTWFMTAFEAISWPLVACLLVSVIGGQIDDRVVVLVQSFDELDDGAYYADLLQSVGVLAFTSVLVLLVPLLSGAIFRGGASAVLGGVSTLAIGRAVRASAPAVRGAMRRVGPMASRSLGAVGRVGRDGAEVRGSEGEGPQRGGRPRAAQSPSPIGGQPRQAAKRGSDRRDAASTPTATPNGRAAVDGLAARPAAVTGAAPGRVGAAAPRKAVSPGHAAPLGKPSATTGATPPAMSPARRNDEPEPTRARGAAQPAPAATSSGGSQTNQRAPERSPPTSNTAKRIDQMAGGTSSTLPPAQTRPETARDDEHERAAARQAEVAHDAPVPGTPRAAPPPTTPPPMVASPQPGGSPAKPASASRRASAPAPESEKAHESRRSEPAAGPPNNTKPPSPVKAEPRAPDAQHPVPKAEHRRRFYNPPGWSAEGSRRFHTARRTGDPQMQARVHALMKARAQHVALGDIEAVTAIDGEVQALPRRSAQIDRETEG